jgi:hypothetical protein
MSIEHCKAIFRIGYGLFMKNGISQRSLGLAQDWECAICRIAFGFLENSSRTVEKGINLDDWYGIGNARSVGLRVDYLKIHPEPMRRGSILTIAMELVPNNRADYHSVTIGLLPIFKIAAGFFHDHNPQPSKYQSYRLFANRIAGRFDG